MSEVLRLTFRELGTRLGITHDGARFLAKRRLWKIVKGNDGRAAVLVTEAELASEMERSSADDRPRPEQERAELLERLEAAEERVRALETKLQEAHVARTQAEEARARAEEHAVALEQLTEAVASLKRDQERGQKETRAAFEAVGGLLRRLRWLR